MSFFKKLFSSASKVKPQKEEETPIPTSQDDLTNHELENDIRQQLSNDEKKIMLVQVKTYMTSHEGADAENAFRATGIMNEELRKAVLEQYVWHYLDDLDENLQCTMQLVLIEVLEKLKPFTDSRHIYEKIMGCKYQGFDE
ncbi:hypothetical protein [Kordia sp.]|uniref:hypothetical protein n=1 Tax=Kordia sp. TaxID=1965332 RepID=UPI003B5C6C43